MLVLLPDFPYIRQSSQGFTGASAGNLYLQLPIYTFSIQYWLILYRLSRCFCILSVVLYQLVVFFFCRWCSSLCRWWIFVNLSLSLLFFLSLFSLFFSCHFSTLLLLQCSVQITGIVNHKNHWNRWSRTTGLEIQVQNRWSRTAGPEPLVQNHW